MNHITSWFDHRVGVICQQKQHQIVLESQSSEICSGIGFSEPIPSNQSNGNKLPCSSPSLRFLFIYTKHALIHLFTSVSRTPIQIDLELAHSETPFTHMQKTNSLKTQLQNSTICSYKMCKTSAVAFY